MKLNNFAAVDHTLDRTGLENVANVDHEIWDEYWSDLDRLARVSELIVETLSAEQEPPGRIRNHINELETQYDDMVTTERRRRLGQSFFREVLIGNYEGRCAVCELPHESLLDAAHIIPWSESDDPQLRLDPTNGLAMCKIHHAAFDQDLLRIHPDDRMVQIADLLKGCDAEANDKMFLAYDGAPICLPEKFSPERDLLRRRFEQRL